MAAEHLPPALLDRVRCQVARPRRILEVGCGNGAFAANLVAAGYETYAFDLSETGVTLAGQRGLAGVRQASAYDDFTGLFPGVPSFGAVIALEVIEHLYDPRKFLARAVEALEPGGTLILSTPYHGYLKNLALAVTGRLDEHFTALWDGGTSSSGHGPRWSVSSAKRASARPTSLEWAAFPISGSPWSWRLSSRR